MVAGGKIIDHVFQFAQRYIDEQHRGRDVVDVRRDSASTVSVQQIDDRDKVQQRGEQV